MHYQTKRMIQNAIGNLPSFIYNLLWFAKSSPVENEISNLRNFVLSLPSDVKEMYAEECRYLESVSLDNLSSIMFPYEGDGQTFFESISVAEENGFPFVLHKGKTKVFFPRYTPLDDVRKEYGALLYVEGLLGSGLKKKSPHCYQDGDFKVEEGDVLLDVGCAEAIFAIDNIDLVSKAYLFENASTWSKPLKKTFAPFMDKTTIVNKLVSDRTSRNETTLTDVIDRDLLSTAQFFVKMDIEGAERHVLKGNADFFKSAKVKLSCCVYHRQDDAREISNMLKSFGYRVRFSDGYMLPVMNGIHYPYFRHGVVYAQNY